MAWERRGGVGRYYTRSRRLNGRVVREYLGSGPVAELAAALDAVEREQREAEEDEARQARRQAEALDAEIGQLCGAVEALAHAALQAAGFRRHHRGEWRKQRGTTTSEAGYRTNGT